MKRHSKGAAIAAAAAVVLLIAAAVLFLWDRPRYEIVVPSTAPVTSLTPTPEPTLSVDRPININTDHSDTLQQLPGSGEKRAAAIIADREANGPFRVPEALTRVAGIGEGILSGLIALVTVS